MTARDIKANVEGYSEMSDEAFARRFYSDRAELIALGVPLHSQRDEFTGEELYTLRSERYFLPPLELTDDELAALQTCLYLLEGKFAYAEPLRLALQNLALGRPGFARRRPRPPSASRCSTRTTPPRCRAGSAKLEGAISKQRTVKFPYWSISRDEERERTRQPVRALPRQRRLVRRRRRTSTTTRSKTFRVSRIRGEIRFATRRERDFRLPADFDIDEYRGRPPWQIGDVDGRGADRGARRHRLVGRAHVRRHGQIEDGVFVTEYSILAAARLLGAAPGRTRGAAGARRAAPRGRAGARARARARTRASRRRSPPRPAAEAGADDGRAAGRPGHAGALRRPPGAARVPARPLRRGHARPTIPGAGDRRALPHPARGARGAPLAAEPRQLRRRLLRGLRGARTATRCTSTRSSSATRSARRRA